MHLTIPGLENPITIPPGQPDLYHVWQDGAWVFSADMLAMAKNKVMLDIEAYRNNWATLGYEVAGYWFQSDATSNTQYLALTMLGTNLPNNIQWKTMSGAFVTMTPALVQAIFQYGLTFVNTVYGVAQYHITAMQASNDPLNYNYETGTPAWPAVYQPGDS